MQTAAVIALKPAAPAAAFAAPKKFAASCASCSFRELCVPAGICAEDLPRFENLVYARRRVKRGEALFNAGDEFKAIYAVRSGFFKSSIADGEGREQVTGFFMGGELLGMEGVGTGRYHGAAIALEDSEVCVLPYALIENLARDVPALQRQLHAILGREIVRDHGVMMLLGSMCAEERLAAFLLNLSKRFTARGYSRSDFNLRMTREELGSYLGLKLETVSRLFSAFQKDGLIEVQQKYVRIRDIAGLERILAAKS
ncbi:MAG TPA: fumarate/nitrate reduction transcriptional regulator Fnr [Burkholderiales bacterium]|nr:fumarate/nitrate reduction transcriptional regulator Fnr [Burkholderiales bacterium]